MRPKPHPSLASADVQMAHFESEPEFKNQYLLGLKCLLSFSSQGHAVTLRIYNICVHDLKDLLMTSFLVVDDIISKTFSGLQSMHQLCDQLIMQ